VQSDSQVRDYRELPGALLRRAQAVDGHDRGSVFPRRRQSEHGGEGLGVVEELARETIVEDAHSGANRHLAFASRVPGDADARGEVVEVSAVERRLVDAGGPGDALLVRIAALKLHLGEEV